MSLAIASSAAAINLPVGSSSDADTAQTLDGALNKAEDALLQSAEQLSEAGDTAAGAITSRSDVTDTTAYQLYADYTDESIGVVAPTGNYVQALVNEFGGGDSGAQEYEMYVLVTADALDGVLEATQLIGFANDDAKDYPTGLFTIDGDLAVSSTATVTKADKPTALTVTYATTHAAAGGFVVPQGFTFTLPSSLNLTPVAPPKEITTSQEQDPVPADAVGTVTIDSPAAKQLSLSSTEVITGKIYVVNTTPTPTLELYFGDDTYLLGEFPESSSGPLTFTFVQDDPLESLPLSSLSLSFPAKTSLFDAVSCSKLGAVTGTATDAAAPLAYQQFADTSDGSHGIDFDSEPVTLSDSATKVTNDCVTTPPPGGASFGGGKTKNGVAQLTVGKTYTITDHSGTKPLYLGFAKAPKVPSGKGTAFKGVGAGNWAITVTVTDEMLKDHTVDFAYKVKSKVYVLKAKISS